jgi:hypothetical protein
MRLGIDIDGVLACFNSGIREVCCEVAGRELPAYREPTKWNYLQDHYGLTPQEEAEVWNRIVTSDAFWMGLRAYDHTPTTLTRLWHAAGNGTDIYFLTTRPGVRAKHQTEQWLWRHGFPHATVLISDKKGPLAQGLKLTAFLDDKPENCYDVKLHSPETRGYLLRQPWNAHVEPESTDYDGPALLLVDSVEEFLYMEGVR